MATTGTVIGRSTRVRGRVTGASDVEVQGFVDGEIAVSGDVTVDVHGLVGASIQGRRLVVRGAVRGDLHGEESVLLEEGARVVGDVKAPRVAVAQGALVRGYVDTGDAGSAAQRAARVAPAARPAAFAPKPAAKAVAQPAPAPAPSIKAAVVAALPPQIASAGANNHASAGHAANNSNARRPPPPVVPALKKAKGQIAKKKER